MSRTFMISLVRHGETMANRQKIMQGQMNTLLSDLGMKQAKLIAERLEMERFTHIFSSDLARAADTARAIVESNQYFSGELVLDSRLRERCFGIFEGKNYAEYRKAAEEAKIPINNFTPQGGETMERVKHRVTEFLDELSDVMAEPILVGCNGPSKRFNSANNQTVNSGASPAGVTSAKNVEKRKEAGPVKALHVDIPGSSQLSKFKVKNDVRSVTSDEGSVTSDGISVTNDMRSEASDRLSVTTDGASVTSDRTPLVSNQLEGVSDLDLSDSKQQSQYCDELPLANVLIVSHGLFLKEMKQIIISKYEGKLSESQVANVSKICPNTGLSHFTMQVSIKNGKVSLKCDSIHLISDGSHLAISEDLASHAKFTGAL